MIVVERHRALLLFGFLSVALIPFFFAGFTPIEVPGKLTPVLLLLEFCTYFLFAMIVSGDSGWRGAAIVALTLTALRFLLSLAAAVILSLFVEGGLGGSLVGVYMSNPLSIIFQIILLLTIAPHLLRPVLPRLVSDEAAMAMGMFHEPTARTPRMAGPASPSGGAMHVYSYPELSEYLTKVVGMEGFLLFSGEGFPLLSHFELGIDEEEASIASNQFLQNMRSWADQLKLQGADQVLIQTEERLVCGMAITDEIRLLLFFTAAMPVEEIAGRLPLIRRTTEEFIQSRDATSA